MDQLFQSRSEAQALLLFAIAVLTIGVFHTLLGLPLWLVILVLVASLGAWGIWTGHKQFNKIMKNDRERMEAHRKKASNSS